MMSKQGGNFKAGTMLLMWVAYLAFLAIIQWNVDGGWFFGVAGITMLPLIVGMAGIWRMYRDDASYSYQEQDEEKRKRDRLDSVLRDLSDEDLIRLRERLSDGAIDDEVLYQQMVGADGELVSKRV